MIVCNRLFLLTFVLQQIFAADLFAAPGRRISLVIHSLRDGSDDVASDKTASVLHQKFSETPLDLVEPEKVEKVLSYYKDYQIPSAIDPLFQTKSLIARAQDHYFQFAYEEAQAELKKAIRFFEENPQQISKGGSLLADAWVTLGLVDAATHQKEKALEDFKRLLQLAPGYAIDLKNFPPAIQKIFQEAKASLEQMPSGAIQIETDPKVAEIYLNGIYQGPSPLQLSGLPAGSYSLSFRAHHYQENNQTIVVEAGRISKLNPKLSWLGAAKRAKEKMARQDQVRVQTEEGLRIARLLNVDKVLLVDVDGDLLTARMIDRRFRASHRPVILRFKNKMEGLEEELNHLTRLLFAQTELNLLKNPNRDLDWEGMGDPVLLKSRKSKSAKKILLGGLGVLGVGGLLAGILAATGGGSTEAPAGSVSLQFK